MKMAGPSGSRGRWGLGQCVFTVDSVVVAMLTCGLLGAPASRRQEAAGSRILNIQKQIRHMIRDYSLLVLLHRRDAGAPSKPRIKAALG
jgi:hypothetical protein